MKFKYIIYMILIIAVSLYIGYYCYSYLFSKISVMISNKSIIPFYHDINLEKNYESIVNSVEAYFDNFWDNIKAFFISIITYITSVEFMILIVSLLEIFVIVSILLMIWISGSNKSYKTTKPVALLIIFVEFSKFIIMDFIEFIIKNKIKLLITVLILTGILPVFALEFLIFMILYLISMVQFNSYTIIFNIFKWCIVKLVDFGINGDLTLKIFICVSLYIIIAFYNAAKRCNINWSMFKAFISQGATINIVDGEPGAGKTLTLSQAQLASTENMIDLYEKAIVEFEIKYPNFNFAKVRLLFKIFFMSFDESEIPNIIKTCPTVMTDLFELNNYINTDLCRMMFNTYYRGTSVISPTPMIDPYHESLTRKMDVQSMRFFKELSAMPYETDITLVYPEMDKEFNSHDSKGEVSDDGTYAFFAFLSHLCDRCGGFWGDAQDRDQIIKRIRGIAGKNYHLKRRKVKMPFMLNLIYKPTLKIYNMLLKLITMYLGYRPKTEKKWTCRRKATVYKRNNLSFLYQCLKYVALLFNKIVGYMEHYQYFKIWADVSTKDDFSNAHEITYCINVMDLDHNGDSIYDSTYFKKFYGQLRDILSNKKGIKQNILMLERWKSMDPEFMEYSETAQRLLSKIVNAQFPKDEENK